MSTGTFLVSSAFLDLGPICLHGCNPVMQTGLTICLHSAPASSGKPSPLERQTEATHACMPSPRRRLSCAFPDTRPQHHATAAGSGCGAGGMQGDPAPLAPACSGSSAEPAPSRDGSLPSPIRHQLPQEGTGSQGKLLMLIRRAAHLHTPPGRLPGPKECVILDIPCTT